MRGVDHVLAALADGGHPPWSWLVGDPCVPPPAALRDAFARAASAPTYPYSPPAGRPALRAVIAERHRVPDRRVVVTAGAKPGLFALLSAILEPGDEILHPWPCYPGYPSMARCLGARPVPVEQHGGSYDEWIDRVRGCLGPATRAVVLSSPANPTGATLAGAEAAKLVECCRSRGVRLICDEVYHEYRYDPEHSPIPADLDPERRTVVQIRSASKAWALCGWRIGWLVADSALAERITERHVSLFGPASGPAQEALENLPDVGEEYHVEARAVVQRRLDRVANLLEQHGLQAVRPRGGFYLWASIGDRRTAGKAGSASERCSNLARRTGVGLWPGDDFGDPRHVRLAVTAPPEARWDEAIAALDDALPALVEDSNGVE